MTRTRQQKRDADAGIAPPAPAPAPKKKRRTKKAPPPIEPAAKAKLVRVLASEPFFLREISSALVYRDVTSLSLVDKGAAVDLKDNDGRTAHDLAIQGNHHEIADAIRGNV